MIFAFPGSPSNTDTAWPANSATAASSVRVVAPVPSGTIVGISDQTETERLRGLNGAQGRPVGRPGDVPPRVDRLDGVEHRASRHCGAVASRGFDGTRDEVRRRKRARTVVDQHDVCRARATARQLFEPGPDAVLPRRPAERGIRNAPEPLGRERLDRGGIEVAVVGMDDGGDRVHVVAAQEEVERAREDGPAAKGPILFGLACAEARSATCGHDKNVDLLGHGPAALPRQMVQALPHLPAYRDR